MFTQPFRTLYLVTPKAELASFTFAADRKRLSRPMPVNLLWVDAHGLVWVFDRGIGGVYPTDRRYLKNWYDLNDKQRKEVEPPCSTFSNAAASTSHPAASPGT